MAENSKIFEIDGFRIRVLRRKIKSLRMRLLSVNEVEIRIPMRTPETEMLAFFAKNRSWLYKQQERLANKAPEPTFADGELCLCFGKAYRIKVLKGRNAARVEEQNREIILSVTDPTDELKRKKQYLQLQKSLLAPFVEELVGLWSSRLKVNPGQIRYREMYSRWGSCNPRSHGLNFALKLAACPPEAVEYVVVHELCHLIEPSHNAYFHRCVAAALPDWKVRKAKLAGAFERLPALE